MGQHQKLRLKSKGTIQGNRHRIITNRIIHKGTLGGYIVGPHLGNRKENLAQEESNTQLEYKTRRRQLDTANTVGRGNCTRERRNFNMGIEATYISK